LTPVSVILSSASLDAFVSNFNLSLIKPGNGNASIAPLIDVLILSTILEKKLPIPANVSFTACTAPSHKSVKNVFTFSIMFSICL